MSWITEWIGQSFEGFVNYIVDSIQGFLSWLGEQLWNAFVWVIDRFIDAIEYFLNTIRGYIFYIIMISFSYIITRHVLKDEKAPLYKKILYPILSVPIGAIIATILDRVIPTTVMLPRFGVAVSVSPAPGKISEKYVHKQISDEVVNLIGPQTVSEKYVHPQTTKEIVMLSYPQTVSETYIHLQHYYESVNLS